MRRSDATVSVQYDSRPGIVKRIYRNMGLLLGGKAGAGIFSLLYMIIAARALGPRDYGILILVHGYTITIGGILCFPGWHAIIRYGSEALRRQAPEALVRLLRLAGAIELGAGLLAIIVAAALAPLIGPRLGWSPEAQMLAVPYSLAVLASVRATPAGYLQLMNRFDLIGVHNSVSPLVRLVGAAIAAFLGAGLSGFLMVWLLAALAEGLVMWLFGLREARRHMVDHRLMGLPHGAVGENSGILRFMIAANADVTFAELAPRIAPLIVGWVLGPTATGLFAVAQRATVVIQQPAQILGQAAYAEFAKLAPSKDDRARLRRALITSTGIAVAIAIPIVVALAVWSDELITIIGGAAFTAAGPLLLWLIFARLVLVAMPPASAALVALGRPALSVTANAATSLALMPAMPLFMMHFGLLGAGMHSLLQAIAVAVLLGWFVWRASRDEMDKPGD